jgi:hypothetical protein
MDATTQNGPKFLGSLASVAAAFLCLSGTVFAQAPSFIHDVAPILAQHCISCHGPAQQLSLYDLSSREAALKGGQKGVAIVPGDAASSALRASPERSNRRCPWAAS